MGFRREKRSAPKKKMRAARLKEEKQLQLKRKRQHVEHLKKHELKRMRFDQEKCSAPDLPAVRAFLLLQVLMFPYQALQVVDSMLPEFRSDLVMLFEVLDSGETVDLEEEVLDHNIRGRLLELFKALSLNLVSFSISIYFKDHSSGFYRRKLDSWRVIDSTSLCQSCFMKS
jgi:hypothetical protein